MSDPAMTMLHRAGVAGLYMTLKALAKRYPTQKSRQGSFKWTLTKTSISLYWKGNDYEALDWLFSESFQISSDGLISLTGLQSHSRESRLAIHIGIKNTFLQHNQFFKSAGKSTANPTIDGLEVAIDYKEAKSYAHKKETQFTETIERASALLYAPVACQYFISPKSYLHDTI